MELSNNLVTPSKQMYLWLLPFGGGPKVCIREVTPIIEGANCTYELNEADTELEGQIWIGPKWSDEAA
jgi:hypothetical protein